MTSYFLLLTSYFFIFIFGLCIGSFLNCLIWRLRKGEGMLNRSYCPKCKKQIAWHDNIPVLSFIWLGGKCRHCKKPISIQYPLVELIAGILFVIAFFMNYELGIMNYGFNNFYILPLIHDSLFIIHLLRDFFIISVMIIIFIYDLRWYLILDKVVLPACAIVFILNLILGITWQNMLISGIIGSSFFLFQFVVSKGKWIGGGDIRLGLLMGFALGWPNVLAAIFLAYLIGSIVGVGLILAGRKQWGSKIPLGIFLSSASVIVLFWGEQIINWYFNLF
ncbi:prepilin peptidase [Patescibacteria group bacterium]|nr:prepilin peptidase [Patescibacteria group bacterium]MBU4600597.1 prepilin peptidase [Patescibacteria group bacterium]MCG2698037.1 prepilin peptidase [Candidatus Parcubacteria bacterium]